MASLTRINDNAFIFSGVFQLDIYSAKKYKNANQFNYYISDGTEGMRIGAVTFNNPQEIEINGNNHYISIVDFKMHPMETCAVLGSLNRAKNNFLNNIHCYFDGKHIYIISDKWFDTIELGIVLLNKEKIPDYMNILFHLTSDAKTAADLLTGNIGL